MDLVIFEENKPLVLEGLEQGEFDYIDAASERSLRPSFSDT